MEDHHPNEHAIGTQSPVKKKKKSAQTGIKLFGEGEVAGILNEYTQLYRMNVFAKVNSEKLSREEKKQALRMITLIK